MRTAGVDLCALQSVCKRKTYSTKACDRVRGSHSSSMSSSSSPNAHSWCTTQPHLLRLCIRGTLTCKHIPMSASHTSSMHIPRAHKPALALKLPLCVYFFCEHTHTSRIYHNHSFNWTCCQAVKVLVKFKFCLFFFFLMAVEKMSGCVFTFSVVLPTGGGGGVGVHRTVGFFGLHIRVFEPTYLSTCALPHIHLCFCDHRHTSCS